MSKKVLMLIPPHPKEIPGRWFLREERHAAVDNTPVNPYMAPAVLGMIRETIPDGTFRVIDCMAEGWRGERIRQEVNDWGPDIVISVLCANHLGEEDERLCAELPYPTISIVTPIGASIQDAVNLWQIRSTYYVATDGSDANPCTQSNPCRTIARGSSMLSAGDTLYIRGGTYTESLDHGWQGFYWRNGTSWGSMTRYANYPNETVVIRPSDLDAYTMRFENTTQYVEVNGLVIDAVNAYSGIKVDAYSGLEAKDIRIANSEIKNSPMHGILGGGSSCEFLNNDIHDNAQYGFYSGASYDGSGSLYAGNRIHDNGGYAMHMFNEGGGVDNNVIRNNVMYKNGSGYFFDIFNKRDWRTPPAVIISKGRNNSVYNNLIYNNHAGMFVTYGAVDSQIFNNTIYGNETYGLDINAAYSGSLNAQVINNIVYGNGASQLTNDASNTTLQNNLTDQDPRFVNPAASDFHLQPGSPAIDAGASLTEIPTDVDGISRPQGSAYDIGAYEYRSGGALRGDLDGNGKLDLTDVRWSIEMLVGTRQLNLATADLDGNGALTLADVQALIRLLVGVP